MQYNLESIIVIRHAESLRNSLKRGGAAPTAEQLKAGAASHPDWLMPLSEKGRQQATRLNQNLRSALDELQLDDRKYTLCHSGFLRCIETAELGLQQIKDRMFSECICDIRLRERDAGYVYDMPKQEFDEQFSYTHRHHDLLGDFFYRPPGGESLADVHTRLASFFNDLALNKPNNKNLIIISHGGAMRAMHALFANLSPIECVKTVTPNNCELWARWNSINGYCHSEIKDLAVLT